MNTAQMEAIERVLDKRSQRGATDSDLINWLNCIKIDMEDLHSRQVIDSFIDAIRQTPLF